MKLDRTTIKLFSPFFREVANPKRRLIKGVWEFLRFIEQNNGVNDCYIDLYPWPFNGLIDKLFFDVDGINGYGEALPYAQKFYEFLTEEKGLSVIPVASGKKGFHLYVLLKPRKYENAKELLYKVEYSLIVECFGNVKAVTVTDAKGKDHPTLRNERGLIYFDPKVIGDVRRFVRVPNTLRPPENLNYCTYLPPDGFLRMTERTVAEHMKEPHVYDYNLDGDFPALHELEVLPDLEARLKCRNGDFAVHAPKMDLAPKNVLKFLKPLLRPCLYNRITQPEPRHAVRVAVTVDLLQAGLSKDTIFNIYKALGWRDWDPDITRYQIEHCEYLKPYSCAKLRRLGIPRECCVG